MLTVIKEFTFDAAHYLPGYRGKCADLHGHGWVLQVGITGKVNQITGMVIDFGELANFVNSEIIERVDHVLLNDVDEEFASLPTAENIVLWIVEKVNDFCSKTNLDLQSRNSDLSVSLVRLWETPINCCEWKA
jgi:6-pyruvoyltetrahydropterin/6-carboxytetrahydropterin synthase